MLNNFMLLVFIVCVVYIVWRIGRRSGVTNDDLFRKLPGDEIIKNPSYIADRATIIHASPETIWPWLVQLGKERAGWYAPHWVESIVVWNPKKHIKRKIQPEFQKLKVGDIVPDWGPGSLQALEIKPNKVLLYGAIKPHDKKGDYFFSWVHTLEEISPNETRLYTRLRIKAGNPFMKIFMLLGGLFDWGTIVVMYAGLKEILKEK